MKEALPAGYEFWSGLLNSLTHKYFKWDCRRICLVVKTYAYKFKTKNFEFLEYWDNGYYLFFFPFNIVNLVYFWLLYIYSRLSIGNLI